MKAKSILSLALLAGLGTLSSAALIYQTGFEASEGYANVGTTNYISYHGAGNGLGQGWTVLPTNADTGIDLVGDVWYNCPDSPDGDQWIDLIGTTGPGGLERTFAVKAGYEYKLDWSDFTNLTGSGASYTVDFGSYTNVVTANANAWLGRTATFVAANDGTATLRFYSTDPGYGNTGIDAVLIYDNGGQGVPVVPEPFTMAIGAAGLAVGMARRRRK